MKAVSLSFNLPNKGCNKKCPYCISKMTGENEKEEFFNTRIKKAKTIAKNAQVNSIILTGKGEPLLSLRDIKQVCEVFKDFPIELQTNGILLADDTYKKFIYRNEIDAVAVSIDGTNQLEFLRPHLDELRETSTTIRLTINLIDDIMDGFKTASSFFEFFKGYPADQVSLRSITIPSNPVKTEESEITQNWIINNVSPGKESVFLQGYANILKEKGIFVQTLPFGAKIYMLNGVSYTHFDYCIQDTNNGEDIRSLIYYPDGHMSTSWYGSNHGRVF